MNDKYDAINKIGEKGTFVRKLFFASYQGQMDILATSYESPIGPYAIIRSRYYHGSEAFDSDDEKYSRVLKPRGDEGAEGIEEGLRNVFADLSQSPLFGKPDIYEEIDIFSADGQVFYEKIKDKPWCHVKVVPLEETK